MARKSKKPFKVWLIPLVAIVVIVILVLYYFAHHNSKANTGLTNSTKQTIKSAESSPSSQPSSTSMPGASKSLNTGGSINENGQAVSNLPPSSDWATSSSGAITLQEPTVNTVLSNGDTITGLANVSNISFILSNSSVGLIDQGNLSVVNGRFTGKLDFTSTSKLGTLQVYYPNPTNGAEEDMVEIDVSFN